MSVTRLGVSLLNVVATMDSPASHHGTARPDAKNSEVLRPARRPKNSAGTKQTSSVARTMAQSRGARVMARHCTPALAFRGRRRRRVLTDVGRYLSRSDNMP